MPTRERFTIGLCLCVAAIIFITGIRWGLPSRDADPFLFGQRTPWTGKEIIELAGQLNSDPNQGADVDLNPQADRSRPIILNAADPERAEIVRRYRLFTYQPDEWITMRSLAGMSPGTLRLDPRVYQYGGLWIYPVGALIKAASLVGLIDLRSGPDALAYYMDHPHAFARFYVVARLYSAGWGIVGAWAVYMLARTLSGRPACAGVAALAWAMMPVVVNMAHEAKPHLAGLSLMLLAILAANRYVETGSRRWLVGAGAACGAAFGMVVSSLIIFVILPLMTLLRVMPWRRRVYETLLACAVGGAVYCVTNPFVPINLVRNREVLRSNIGTSTAMYHATFASGVLNALRLIVEAASPVIVLLPIAFLLLFRVHRQLRTTVKQAAARTQALQTLITVPAMLVAVQFVMLAAGKPGEYGRFALLVTTLLSLKAAVFPWLAFKPRAAWAASAVLLAGVASFGGNYLRHFISDASSPTSRLVLAAQLQELHRAGARRLALVAEPAPYCLPPVDLWGWELTLLPRNNGADASSIISADADVLIRAVDRPARDAKATAASAPISWADKPFDVQVPPTSLQSPPSAPSAALP